jgi:hypothetical protein
MMTPFASKKTSTISLDMVMWTQDLLGLAGPFSPAVLTAFDFQGMEGHSRNVHRHYIVQDCQLVLPNEVQEAAAALHSNPSSLWNVDSNLRI